MSTVEQDQLVAAVGAVLFASGEPVQPKEIASAMKGVKLPEVKQAIEALEAHYAKNEAGLRI